MKKEKLIERQKLQKDIGIRFLALRNKLGKNAFEIGDPSLTHPGSISRLESGQSKPSLELLQSLATDFCVNLNWLITGEGPMFLKKRSNTADDT